MKILITGGTGFLGRRLTEVLSRRDNEIHIISRDRGNEGHAHHKVDICDKSAVVKAVTKIQPEWIFHLAADIRRDRREEPYEEMHAVNVTGTLNMLDASVVVSPKAFVAVGSFEEYGSVSTPFLEDGDVLPVSAYGKTKAEASEMVARFGKDTIPATVLRFPVLYGPEVPATTFIGKIKECIKSGERVSMASGEQGRDFLFIDDAVRALILAAEKVDKCRGEIINVCSGTEVTLLSVISLAEKMCGRSNLADLGTIPHREGEQFSYVGSNEKAKKLLGWEPNVSLKDGLRRTLLDLA